MQGKSVFRIGKDRDWEVQTWVNLGGRCIFSSCHDFALNFLVWFFGPIPMFVSTIFMMMILFCHDTRDPRKLIMTKISKQLPVATSSIPPWWASSNYGLKKLSFCILLCVSGGVSTFQALKVCFLVEFSILCCS